MFVDSLNSSQIGTIVEYKCILFLLEQGITVLSPIGNYSKYDILIELKSKFYRIQCKHSTIHDNSNFVFKCCSQMRDGSRTPYSDKDCDFIMTEVNGKFYLFPVSDLNNTIMKKVWLKTPKNKLNSILLASNYEALKILETL